jgi:hypothetical protein
MSDKPMTVADLRDRPAPQHLLALLQMQADQYMKQHTGVDGALELAAAEFFSGSMLYLGQLVGVTSFAEYQEWLVETLTRDEAHAVLSVSVSYLELLSPTLFDPKPEPEILKNWGKNPHGLSVVP